jgi:hypothetical protein
VATSSFSLSFCLTVRVSQPVRLAALERHDPDDLAESSDKRPSAQYLRPNLQPIYQ